MQYLYVLLAFLLFFILERLFPLRERRNPQLPRLFVNLVMSVLTYATASLILRPVTLRLINWSDLHSFGILKVISLPASLELLFTFLLLDLSFYYWHLMNHKFSFLWRFHKTHHLDPDLDTSTGFRFHWGETFLSTGFRVAQVLVIGVSLEYFLLYELTFQIVVYFHHSNLKLPRSLENILSKVVVTTRMHGIHHGQLRTERDSNYSVLFSFWDRIHRTFTELSFHENVRIGLPEYDKPENNKILNVLLLPFK